VIDTEPGTATAELEGLETMGGDGSEECAEPLETGTGTT
jgi:hypothetical protein